MEDKNMGCKYCEDMSLVDEHDGWAEHEGAEFESNVRECNSSCRVIRHELDGYADYSLAFRVDEEWEETKRQRREWRDEINRLEEETK